MKKLLSSLFLMCSFSVFAQKSTTDKISIFQDTGENGGDAIELNGESDFCYLTARLEGSQYYTAYQMDIHFPEGMNVTSIVIANDEYTSDGNVIYASHVEGSGRNQKTVWDHSLQYNMIGNNTYRVICKSDISANFTLHEGDLFYINITASAFMKPGDVDILVDNIYLTRNEDTNGDGIMHGVSYIPSVPCGGTIEGVSGECNNVPLNISSAKWSTCILPFATEIPTGVKAYTSSTSDDDYIFLTEANSIEAYTPYILYSEGGYSGTVSGTVDASGYPESGVVTVGNLTGAIVPQTVNNGYILQNHEGIVKFYAIKNDDFFIVPAGKCWMNIASNNVKAFNFMIKDEETGIEYVTNIHANDVIYDMVGRRVSTMKQGGLYIKNGEKFINK